MNSDTSLIPQSSQLTERLKHPEFAQPNDKNIKLWRYMSLPKLISILTTKSLNLARIDRMADQFEGTITKATLEGIQRYQSMIGQTLSEEAILNMYRRTRETSYISCWHANEYESEAMWQLYGAKGGVAIQTSYDKLTQSIANDGEVYIGLVKYIDYDNAHLPSANMFSPIMHKRKSFEHEKEVRLVKWVYAPPFPANISLEWDINIWAEAIFVDPYAPRYYYDSVKAVLDCMAPVLSGMLKYSAMNIKPII
ncbi:MAG TPA: DUF2971 domain-containing protein [Cellvibrionaceae bacterium]